MFSVSDDVRDLVYYIIAPGLARIPIESTVMLIMMQWTLFSIRLVTDDSMGILMIFLLFFCGDRSESFHVTSSQSVYSDDGTRQINQDYPIPCRVSIGYTVFLPFRIGITIGLIRNGLRASRLFLLYFYCE
jgi:hypothetical protein